MQGLVEKHTTELVCAKGIRNSARMIEHMMSPDLCLDDILSLLNQLMIASTFQQRAHSLSKSELWAVPSGTVQAERAVIASDIRQHSCTV